MKSLLLSACLLGVVFLTGCVSAHDALVLDPVGPPDYRPNAPDSTGLLVVYSAFDPNAHFNSLPYNRFYTDYEVLSEDGKLLQRVRNNPNPSVPGPTRVELPVGEYRVRAEANGYGTVTVPVVIALRETTTMHLEGSGGWHNRAALASANPVRLPDGRIVGWRAKTTAAASINAGGQTE